MVSDKPPRRSRTGKTPVTIDLAAQELAADEKNAIAEPVRANDSDEPIAEPLIDRPSEPAPAADAEAMETAPAQSAPAAGEAAAPDSEPAKVDAETRPSFSP